MVSVVLFFLDILASHSSFLRSFAFAYVLAHEERLCPVPIPSPSFSLSLSPSSQKKKKEGEWPLKGFVTPLVVVGEDTAASRAFSSLLIVALKEGGVTHFGQPS